MRRFTLLSVALGASLVGISSAQPGSIGCFGDNRSDRVLAAKWSSTLMTPAVCADHCRGESSSYTYYATQYGRECWCQEESIDLSHAEGKCDYPCSGDESIVCGGFDSFSLYNLEEVYSPSSPTDGNYVGCFADDRNDRVLGTMTSSSSMTSESCASYCAIESPRNMYYATQWGQECWCSAEVDLRHGDGTCNFACTGDAGTTCGGFDAFDLFELEGVDRPSPPSEDFYLGCFADDKRDRVLEDKMPSTDMTVEMCEDYCMAMDKPFFALQWGQECWCGGCELLDEGQHRYDRHGTTSCVGYPCTGDASRDCGAYDAFSLYYRGACATTTTTPTTTPTATVTPTVTPIVGADAVCEIVLVDTTTVPTPLGGSSLTVTASPCEFDPSAVFDVFSFEGDLLEVVAGELIDANTAKFTLPPLSMDTRVITVSATSTAGEEIVGTIQVFDAVAIVEFPSAGFANVDGTARLSAVTEPPSDLQLGWDQSAISAGSVEIVLVSLSPDTEELEDVAVLGEQPNTGSYLIPSEALDGFDLGSAGVLFKVAGIVSPSDRRLQDGEKLPIVFPGIVTTGLLAWLEDLSIEASTTELCKTAFADDQSKCQCFFTAERLKPGRGVQLNAFDKQFRCPSSIACILEPEVIIGKYTSRPLLSSSKLASGWKNDAACPFGECEFDSTEDDRTIVSCERSLVGAAIWDYTFGWKYPDACELHPGAAFCVRTDEATSPGGGVTGIGNQCCYNEAGDIMVDATIGGGTVDKHEAELFGPGLEPFMYFDHTREDTDPFNWCCDSGDAVNSWLCQLYLEMRPVDAGDGFEKLVDDGSGNLEPLPGCSAAPPGGENVTETVTFSVTAPQLASTFVDFGLLVDVSGSYGDDIANLKSLAPELVLGLSNNGDEERDLRLALASFSDYPSFTTPTDSPYTLKKSFDPAFSASLPEVVAKCGDTFALERYCEIFELPDCDDEGLQYTLCLQREREAFIGAVNDLALESGGDVPESQTVALFRAAEDWSWRDGALKILAITTDASFHLDDDNAGSVQYESLETVIAVCVQKNIKILALYSDGSIPEMDAIAEGTGGVALPTENDSSDIVSAILQGLEDVVYNSVEVEWACRDDGLKKWTHNYPESIPNVPSGTEMEFTVTVTVPAGVTAGIRCVALVIADEVLIGGQEFVALADGSISSASINPLSP